MKITPEEFFGTQDVSRLGHTEYVNAIRLLHAVNLLREELGFPLTVTSGYRSFAHNQKIGGAPGSNHVLCAAIDLADPDGKIKTAVQVNDNALLKKYGLYMESAKDTPTWCHLQIVAPKSGSRVFGK